MHELPLDVAIECRDAAVARGGRVVLRGVNLTIRGDERVAIIGPNGAGKSSLLLALLGLIAPASGTIRVEGRDVARLPPRLRGRLAAYVPQVVERIPAFTVCDVVAGGRFAHLPPLGALSREDWDAVWTAIDRCGLRALADRPINEVSGGERQKALLAAAFAQDAKLLLLDEPTTALDPAVQIELVDLLRSWHAAGRGLVVVSHDLHLPAALEARVVALRDGVVVADGPAAKVLRPDRLAAFYGGAFEAARTESGDEIVVPRWSAATR